MRGELCLDGARQGLPLGEDVQERAVGREQAVPAPPKPQKTPPHNQKKSLGGSSAPRETLGLKEAQRGSKGNFLSERHVEGRETPKRGGGHLPRQFAETFQEKGARSGISEGSQLSEVRGEKIRRSASAYRLSSASKECLLGESGPCVKRGEDG